VAQVPVAYPASLTVDYPERTLDRLSTLFRLFLAIPILIILAGVNGATGGHEDNGLRYQLAAGGLIFAPIVLMLLFRQKYPRWWFDWNVALTGFVNRVSAYMFLLTDQYPSTDEEQSVHIAIDYPNARTELSRWLPLVKWFLAIPHYVVLVLLGIGAVVCVTAAWFSILITGRYPRIFFDYVVGVMRWSLRVAAYAFLLTTDRYPPFSLSA